MRILVPRPIDIALCIAFALTGATGKLEGCGFTNQRLVCDYDSPTYRIEVPKFADPNYDIPVVVLLHDAAGSGRAVFANKPLLEAFVGNGYGVIAPDALPRQNRRIKYRGERPGLVEGADEFHPFTYSRRRFLVDGGDGAVRNLEFGKDTGWYFYNVDRATFSSGDPKSDFIGRDEIQALRDVLAHANEKYGTSSKPALVVGTGHGGSLVWQIACYAPEFARILAPVGGAFWREIPKNCLPGANLTHTHHRSSAFWPLEGIGSNERRYARTSIYENLEMLLRVNRCGADRTAARDDENGLNHTVWADCAGNSRIEFTIMDDPFDFQSWWLDEILSRIKATGIGPAVEVPEVAVETGPTFRKAGEGLPSQPADEAEDAEEPATRFKRPGSDAGSLFKQPKY